MGSMPERDDSIPPDDRREPRVASVTSALLRGWWIIAAFVAVGVIGAAIFTLIATDTYSATASVYIGQTTDANGNPMASLTSNARAAAQLLDSDAVRQEVAEQVGGGLTAAELRRATTIETPSQAVKTTQSIVNFVVITVTDADAGLAADAANAFADVLLARLTPAAEQRSVLLEAQETALSAALEASRARSRQAEKQLAALRDGGGADAAVAAAPYLAVVQAAATEQQALLSSLQKAQLMLQVAETSELPRLLHEAVVPDAKTGPDMALNVAAGALAGLVVGILVALARARRRETPA
jgi:uncharacterized protein involved in exopolysaccharide biosynthesis